MLDYNLLETVALIINFLGIFYPASLQNHHRTKAQSRKGNSQQEQKDIDTKRNTHVIWGKGRRGIYTPKA